MKQHLALNRHSRKACKRAEPVGAPPDETILASKRLDPPPGICSWCWGDAWCQAKPRQARRERDLLATRQAEAAIRALGLEVTDLRVAAVKHAVATTPVPQRMPLAVSD